MRKEKLEQIKEMIPLMKKMVDEDLAISVWNTEGVVLYFQKAESFPLHFDIGYKLEDKSDSLFTAMTTGKPVHNIIPKEVFGVHIEGNLVPVFDEGKVVGCIASVYSLEKIVELENENNRVRNILSESKGSINDILNAAISTANNLQDVNKYMDNLNKDISSIFSVVESIKSNTSRTKMLSLNASIEAARAGDSGQGFKIVANEMGKLSQMSSESVTDINYTLNEMTKSLSDVTESIKQINNDSFKNSGVVEKIINELNTI